MKVGEVYRDFDNIEKVFYTKLWSLYLTRVSSTRIEGVYSIEEHSYRSPEPVPSTLIEGTISGYKLYTDIFT